CLESEDGGGEQGAGSAGEDRSHADERGDAKIDRGAGEDSRSTGAEDEADGAADGEERRQRPAGCPAAEGNRPADEFPQRQRRDHAYGEMIRDDVADVVVADAE